MNGNSHVEATFPPTSPPCGSRASGCSTSPMGGVWFHSRIENCKLRSFSNSRSDFGRQNHQEPGLRRTRKPGMSDACAPGSFARCQELSPSKTTAEQQTAYDVTVRQRHQVSGDDRITLHDLADDAAWVVRELGDGFALPLGRAFGHALLRVVAAGHPERVGRVMLAASHGSEAAPDIATARSIKGISTSRKPNGSRCCRRRPLLPVMTPGPGSLTGIPEHWRCTMRWPRPFRSPDRACGLAPTLGVSGALDPSRPQAHWHEPSDQLGSRVTSVRIAEASHAFLPEQPDRVAEAVLPRHRDAAAKLRI